MGRLIDVDNIEYYLEEGGSAVAFKADIDQIPTADIDTDSAYAEGWTAAESKYRAMMSDGDCISRQAAIDALEKVAELFPWRVPGKRDTYDSYNEAWNDAIGRAEMEIESLPSAQPEIIRCKDCVKREHCRTTNVWAIAPSDDWYCADAERITDG